MRYFDQILYITEEPNVKQLQEVLDGAIFHIVMYEVGRHKCRSMVQV